MKSKVIVLAIPLYAELSFWSKKNLILNCTVSSESSPSRIYMYIHLGPVTTNSIFSKLQCGATRSVLKNIHTRHPIARLLGRSKRCLLWIQLLIDFLLQLLQWRMHYNSTLLYSQKTIQSSLSEWDMRCLSWVQILNHVLSLWWQCCMSYHAILVLVLTYWDQGKMAAILPMIFSIHFLVGTLFYLDSNFTEICFQWCN